MKYFLAAIGGATAIMLLFYFADQGVLATAAKYADDEPKLIGFMRDMGYPKIGEWCGEFAASVIKRAGGTPPSGAAIASNWRRYGTPDAMPHVGDIAVASRGVPTGATGSHVGFVTGVDLENGTFTLESGNASNIYTTRKISCFSFHAPPNNVLSALNGNGVPSGTAIGNALTGRLLSHASIEMTIPDDCSEGSMDTGNNDDEMQNDDDSLQWAQALANRLDGERLCVRHLPLSDAPRFCMYELMNRGSIMYRPSRRCATTTKDNQCLAWRARASACFTVMGYSW
jgi:uncharacterized protein (TIGR02594 family)